MKRTMPWVLVLCLLALGAGTGAWFLVAPSSATPIATTNLSWDVVLPAGRSIIPNRHFPAPWRPIINPDDPSKTGHQNSSNKCIIWPETGPLDAAVDTSHGDRSATISLIESITHHELEATDLNEYAFRERNKPTKTADALLVNTSSQSAIIARAFISGDVGLSLRVECPDSETLDQTIRSVIPEHFSVARYIRGD